MNITTQLYDALKTLVRINRTKMLCDVQSKPTHRPGDMCGQSGTLHHAFAIAEQAVAAYRDQSTETDVEIESHNSTQQNTHELDLDLVREFGGIPQPEGGWREGDPIDIQKGIDAFKKKNPDYFLDMIKNFDKLSKTEPKEDKIVFTKDELTGIRRLIISTTNNNWRDKTQLAMDSIDEIIKSQPQKIYSQEEVQRIIGAVAYDVRTNGYGGASVASVYAKIWLEEYLNPKTS